MLPTWHWETPTEARGAREGGNKRRRKERKSARLRPWQIQLHNFLSVLWICRLSARQQANQDRPDFPLSSTTLVLLLRDPDEIENFQWVQGQAWGVVHGKLPVTAAQRRHPNQRAAAFMWKVPHETHFLVHHYQLRRKLISFCHCILLYSAFGKLHVTRITAQLQRQLSKTKMLTNKDFYLWHKCCLHQKSYCGDDWHLKSVIFLCVNNC